MGQSRDAFVGQTFWSCNLIQSILREVGTIDASGH